MSINLIVNARFYFSGNIYREIVFTYEIFYDI